jgi:single-strand DNA-binding protein
VPNFCQVQLIGHVGKDPVLTEAASVPVARFSLATSRKRSGGDTTTWWEVTAWKKTADVAARYVKKGDAVMVVGEAWAEEWTDKQGGKRTSLKVEAARLVLLGGKRREEAAPVDGEDVPSGPAPSQGASASDDRPPFAPLRDLGV